MPSRSSSRSSAAACEAGAEPDVPEVPEEYASGDVVAPEPHAGHRRGSDPGRELPVPARHQHRPHDLRDRQDREEEVAGQVGVRGDRGAFAQIDEPDFDAGERLLIRVDHAPANQAGGRRFAWSRQSEPEAGETE